MINLNLFNEKKLYMYSYNYFSKHTVWFTEPYI